MINLKKQDNVADAVNEILQQEALKGNQHKIDELSKSTLSSYAKKGALDSIMRFGKASTTSGNKKPDHAEADKAGRRYGGVVKAIDRLAKEEVEELDELSKSTLSSYLDKKKSEYMKGKTQSGSKENAKDIQNMGKAHDKMKKEETQFNDHEKGAAQRLRDMRKNEKEAEKRDKQYQAMRNNKQKQGAVQRLNDMGKNEKEAEKMDKQYQAMRNKKTLKQMKERLEEPVLDELIYEVMSQDASAGDYIHDFIHSDNPKFAGKSDAKRKEMALAAYYSKKNEEAVNEGLKDAIKNVAKKTFKALTGGSDKDHLDRLKKDMYKKEETETVEEGWDDMVKAAQEKVKSGPKPSGGSGKKEGSRYGGSKQKEKPEQDVKEATDTVEKDSKTGKVKSWMHTGDWKKDNGKDGRGKVTNMSDKARRRTEKMSEGKDPNMDAGVGSQPNFATDMTKPMKVAQTLAKNSLSRMRNEMMGKKNV